MRPDAAVSRDRPLQGRRVAVTRPEDGAGGLADQLRARGADVIELPLIRIMPPADAGPLHEAARRFSAYHWLVFTSANGVRALQHALHAEGVRVPVSPNIAVVGTATADAVRTTLGWSVTVVPDEFTGAAITAAMSAVDRALAGRRVLWPRAEAARDTLRHDLAAAGAELDAPVAYRTVHDHDAAAELARRVEAGEVDAITFTSPSAVHCYAAARGVARDALIAVIGPTTASAAREAGYRVHVCPAEHSAGALVEALAQHLLTER